MFWNPNNSKNKLKEKQKVAINEAAAQQLKHKHWRKGRTKGGATISSTFTYYTCG